MTDVSADLSKGLLASSSALLGISAATLVFFGDYVQKTTSWLFEKRDALKEYQNSLERMGRVFLRLIFLQFIMFWSLLALGASAVLIAISLYFVNSPLGSTISLALFLDGMVTVILWMSMFVLSSTPGRWTYNALNISAASARIGSRFASTVLAAIEFLANVATLSGFIIALYVVWLFISTPSRIVVASNGIWIQGVPFSWIFSSLVLMSLRSAMSALKALWKSLKR